MPFGLSACAPCLPELTGLASAGFSHTQAPRPRDGVRTRGRNYHRTECKGQRELKGASSAQSQVHCASDAP